MNAKTWDLTQAKALFTTPTFIPYTLIWICHGIGGWGITLVLPTVIFDLGITDTARTQLMTIVRLSLHMHNVTDTNNL